MVDEVLQRNSDNIINGRLEMTGHKMRGFGSQKDSDDTVNKECTTARLPTTKDILNNIIELCIN